MKAPHHHRLPNWLALERSLQNQGYQNIAGVDEVGRGCLAGPVFAAAVVLPTDNALSGVNDSKKLSPKQRDTLFEKITAIALDWSVASVTAEEIDRINIHQASLKAMALAVAQLTRPDYVLIDGRFKLPVALGKLPEGKLPFPQRPIIRGDSTCYSIAAASIVAKVTRDRWISEAGRQFPEYQFERHKGYATQIHRLAIQQYGLTPLHRRSFHVSSGY